MKGGTDSTAGPPLHYSGSATTRYSLWDTRKMKGWAFKCKRRLVAKLGRAWTTDDKKLVRLSALPVHAFTPQVIYVKSRMYRYDHVWGVEDPCAMSDVAVSGHPLVHTGNVPLPTRDLAVALMRCRSTRRWRARIIVRSRRRAGRPSRIWC